MSHSLLRENISRLWASVLANELFQQGAKHIFIAPGMRNAPLIAAFAAIKEFEVHVGMDERGLSYQALGYAKMSGQTAVLVCTSGTAAANFYPAVIEAMKSQVGLLVISADRPPELAQSDANQTIDQKHLYNKHVKHFLDLGAPDAAMPLNALARLSAHAWQTSKLSPAGPVHINIAFREPLDGKTTALERSLLEQATVLEKQSSPSRQVMMKNSFDLSSVSPFLEQAKNPLIIIGELDLAKVAVHRKKLISSLKKCPHSLNIDVTSSLKFDFSLDDGLIPTFDHPEVFTYFDQNPPDLVIHLGGRLTSKHYYRYLNKHAGEFPIVHICSANALSDSGHAVTHQIIAEPVEAISSLEQMWPKKEVLRSDAFHNFIHKKIEIIESSDKVAFPYVSKRVVEMLPDDHALVIGNSTLIRSFDSYASLEKAKGVNVLTHRGVSGIEGFFASASGCSLASNKPTTMVIGDVSALHDLNSLELIARSKAPVICIVVNNFGGGIFTLLNLEKGEDIYPVITSPHERQIAPMAQAFGLKTWQARTRKEFESSYKEAISLSKSCMIEVLVDNQADHAIYQQLKTIKLS